jgi:hypothetical protein
MHSYVDKKIYSCKKWVLHVFWTDLDLMITRMKTYLGEDLCTDHLIKQDVSTRKWILVLDGDSVQKQIIHTQS